MLPSCAWVKVFASHLALRQFSPKFIKIYTTSIMKSVQRHALVRWNVDIDHMQTGLFVVHHIWWSADSCWNVSVSVVVVVDACCGCCSYYYWDDCEGCYMIVYVTCWHISIRTYNTISLVVVLHLMRTKKTMKMKMRLMIFLKMNVMTKMHNPFPYPWTFSLL